MEKPNKEDYGFVENSGFDSEPSGWVVEEGEDYYLEALEKYNQHIKELKTMPVKTIKYRVKIEFPWSMHNVDDIIEVYESSHTTYVVGAPDDYGDGDDYSKTEKFDLREFPDIYELVK